MITRIANTTECAQWHTATAWTKWRNYLALSVWDDVFILFIVIGVLCAAFGLLFYFSLLIVACCLHRGIVAVWLVFEACRRAKARKEMK